MMYAEIELGVENVMIVLYPGSGLIVHRFVARVDKQCFQAERSKSRVYISYWRITRSRARPIAITI